MDPKLVARSRCGESCGHFGRDAERGEGTFGCKQQLSTHERETGFSVVSLHPKRVLATLAFESETESCWPIGHEGFWPPVSVEPPQKRDSPTSRPRNHWADSGELPRSNRMASTQRERRSRETNIESTHLQFDPAIRNVVVPFDNPVCSGIADSNDDILDGVAYEVVL
jgi:hypothetical protein